MGVRRAVLALAIGNGLLLIGAGPATADTLFASPARTTPVAVGTTANVLSGTLTSTGTLGGVEVSNDCTSSTLSFSIVQNDAAAIVGTVTSGTFSGCDAAVTGNFPWRFTLRGGGVASGANTVFTTSTWDDVSMTVQSLTSVADLPDAAGSPPTNGVYVLQTTATGTGICLVWSDAPVPGPFLTNGKMNTTYCLEGAPATTWSIGPTLTSFLRADPAGTTVPSGATVSNKAGSSIIMLGTGNVICQGAWGFTAGAGGGAVITGALDSVAMTGCFDTVPGITVTACARFPAGTSPVSFQSSTATGGSVTVTAIYLRCALTGTTNGCYYNSSTLTGTLSNASASLGLGGGATHQAPVGVTDDTGTQCGSFGTFTSGLSDLTSAGTTVTLTQS
jgi:hypothetical protein